MVHVTILPSEDTDMKLRLPSRSFFCHEICNFRDHTLTHVYIMYNIMNIWKVNTCSNSNKVHVVWLLLI